MVSSDSLSFPSEPPDIRKWFSSYVYESPELNSINDLNDSSGSGLAEIGESEKGKGGNFDENGSLEKGDALLADGKATSNGFLKCKNLARSDKCAVEVLENSDALSLSSEPPDVKNWFSSYVYESPAIDTSYEFSFHPNEKEFDEEGNDDQNFRRGKEELTNPTKAFKRNDLESQKSSGGLIRCTNSGGEKESEHNYIPKEHGNGSAKRFELPISDGGSSLDNLNSRFRGEASRMLLDTKSRSDNKIGNLPRNPIQGRDPKKESSKPKDSTKGTEPRVPAKNLDSNMADGKSVENAPCGQDNKENDRNEFAETGFISTRKSKQVDEENTYKRPLESNRSLGNGVTNLPRGSKETVATRKVLLETTNFQPPSVPEIVGKWRCPQKSKPNLGPPLKQLRLEKWVRRV